MRKLRTLYLAGPDVFYPDAAALAARKRALCELAGFEVLTGMDGGLTEMERSEAMAREIYAANVGRVRRADALIANLTPWRGPGADPGTAFETGVAAGLSKPVFAYLNVEEEDDADHCIRVLSQLGGEQDADGRWRDPNGAEIEDFDLPENLMLWGEARRFYVVVTDTPQTDLTGLEMCLDAVRAYEAD
jgi:nucleoside 2-deoxyribosyltransferase